MAARPSIVLVLLAALSSLGASYRTQNFVVEAPTPAIAEQVGQYAEYYRREKAMQWLGQEMPPWPEPCPLRVTVTVNENGGGATSFAFDRGRILGQKMEIEGSLNRLLASVLPHEVTHTVLAQYFRQPVPRWADEGSSVLSEDEIERKNHDALVRTILNSPGRAIPLRRLFAMHEYPRDVMVLYAEGFSVTNFLVGQSNRQTYLAFVNQGMHNGWDDAVHKYYNYKSVEELEQAWLKNLRDSKRQPTGTMVASERGAETPAEAASRITVRQTVPPAQPLLYEPQPLVRGQAPDERDDRSSGRASPVSRPQYLPDVRGPSVSSSPSTAAWPQPSPARLGLPQADAQPSAAQLGQPVAPPTPYAYQR